MEFIPEKLRYHVSNLVALTFVGLVLFSGFAYPLHYGRGFWPFNCDWFMFSYDTGYDFEVEAIGKMKDGTTQKLDVDRYFSMPIGGTSNRFQEVTRDVNTMTRLAHYLCARFPAESITINEVTWPRAPGAHIPASAIDPNLKLTSVWVSDIACGS